MEATKEMIDKVALSEEQKRLAFNAACAHAGQKNNPCLTLYVREAVKALKTLEIEGGGQVG